MMILVIMTLCASEKGIFLHWLPQYFSAEISFKKSQAGNDWKNDQVRPQPEKMDVQGM